MNREIKFEEKLELIKAVVLVADFWEVEPTELISFTAFSKPEKKEEWNKIAREVKEFEEMDIDKRAKKLGLTISYEN